LTETGVIVSFTSAHNVFLGSDGCLLPLVEARLVTEEGAEVNVLGESGELLLRSASIMKGYLGDEAANERTFDSEGWLRTGDIATFKQDPDGIEHLFIVDRKKDIMKVKVSTIFCAYLIRWTNLPENL
jgi:long-subunit acyl-CoA synthetase (AMP-forming)